MDMGKCTSCILYIKQNSKIYMETTISQRNSTLIASFLLQFSTKNQSIPNNIIYSLPPLFPKKKEVEWSSKEFYVLEMYAVRVIAGKLYEILSPAGLKK